MALDEALFDSALQETGVTTVRFYRFVRPTLTFGYRQPLEEACNEPACRERNIEIVRRLTGGRALLHQHELTYSVTAARSGPFRGLSVRETYHAVNSAIRLGLAGLGIPLDRPESAKAEARRALHLPCLAVPTDHEIASGGLKLVASAQRWRRAGFLQQGSILRRVDQELWSQLTPPHLTEPLRATGTDALTDPPSGERALVEALIAGFSAFFGVQPIESPLTPQELSVADSLEEKYESDSWNRGTDRFRSD